MHISKQKNFGTLQVRYLQRHINNLYIINKPKEVPECYGYLAIGYIALGDLENAERALMTRIELAIETKMETMERMAYANLGTSTYLVFP